MLPRGGADKIGTGSKTRELRVEEKALDQRANGTWHSLGVRALAKLLREEKSGWVT